MSLLRLKNDGVLLRVANMVGNGSSRHRWKWGRAGLLLSLLVLLGVSVFVRSCGSV